MKKITVLTAAIFALSSPLASFAMDHAGHDKGKMEKMSSKSKSNVVHEEVVNGVKVTFIIQPMADAMEGMKMEMPKDMKETHHLHVEFKDTKSGKPLNKGDVTIKLQNPDKAEQIKKLDGMQGHFGADFDLSKKGKYGVMCKFQLKDGKVRSAKFWYTVK